MGASSSRAASSSPPEKERGQRRKQQRRKSGSGRAKGAKGQAKPGRHLRVAAAAPAAAAPEQAPSSVRGVARVVVVEDGAVREAHAAVLGADGRWRRVA